MNTNIFKAILTDTYNLFVKYNREIEPRPFMPSQERDFIEKYYISANSILEFGSGGSTLFAINNGINIVSVESDKRFFKFLISHIKNKSNSEYFKILHADIGWTGRYGSPLYYPLAFNLVEKGLKYVITGYAHFFDNPPDLIFVDGRWRVACCLFAIMIGCSKSTILLDDYDLNRSYKSIIEKHFDVIINGRVALLRLKGDIVMINVINDFLDSLKNPE